MASSSSDRTIRAALDEAATIPPAAALSRLRGIGSDRASRGTRLDLAVARAGLAIDARLADPALSPVQRYEWQLRRATANGVRLEQVRRALEQWRQALSAQATVAFDELGIPHGTTGARFAALWREPSGLYADSDAGRAAAVADMRATLDAIRPRLPALFGTLPAACLDVTVRTLDPAEIAAGKGGYRVLPAPGVRGTYIVDLKGIRRRPAFSLPSVVAHELLPGHMIQMPLEALAAPHPLHRRYTGAFPEGWAVYAETLMATDGVFASPRDRLGHIHWMLFRVCRGLADIAIHVDGRAPERVLDDLREWQGVPAYFAPFDRDIARIAGTPATRAAEAWVPLAILAARPRAKGLWRSFHRHLLDDGPMRDFRLLA